MLQQANTPGTVLLFIYGAYASGHLGMAIPRYFAVSGANPYIS